MSNRPAPPVIEQSPAEKFFGLTTRPFSLTPDLRFAYHSRSHTHALEEVTAALRRREGLIVVTGAIGTGKTMLCRTLLETFESRTFLSLVLDPGLEVEDLLRKVLGDFGIINEVDAPKSGPLTEATRHQFVTVLQQFLATLIPLQAHAVIMIDEAQHLSPRVLEEIRLLSNFETDEAKLLQIVLVGQPDLDDLLRRPDMQQLNQRVARRCQLHPLSTSEVADYIERRLTVAASPDGGETPPPSDSERLVSFTPAAARAVALISAGIPRVINTLCDRTLDVAYERQARAIEPGIVAEAAERLRLDIPDAIPATASSRLPRVAAVAALVIALALAAWWWARPADTTTGQTGVPPGVRQAPAQAPARTLPGGTPAAQADTRPADTAGTAPAATAPAPPAAQSAPAAATPRPAERASAPAAAQDQSTSAPAGTASPAAPSGSYQIAVASFRTERRAEEVASQVRGLQLPAVVRFDDSAGWYRVVAGPFGAAEAADAAQATLTRAGLTGTRLSRVP